MHILLYYTAYLHIDCRTSVRFDIHGDLRGQITSPPPQVYRANCDFNQYRKRPRSFVGRDGEHPDASAIAAATATATTPPKPRQATGTFYGLPCVSSVTSVCWMKDGQKFLTAGQDGLVKVSVARQTDRRIGRQADTRTQGHKDSRGSCGVFSAPS